MSIAPAAIGIILNEDSTRVLLVKRKDVPIWVLPGGGIEHNETAEEAVIREVEEETGYQIQIERKCSEYTPLNRLASFTTIFLCRIKKGEPTLSSETAEIKFYSLQNLPSLFFYLHQEWLEEALTPPFSIKKGFISLSFWKILTYFFQHPLYFFRYLWTRYTKV